MEKREQLTNETLSKKFKNQFELVNYAIKLAENMIRSGREGRVPLDIQNKAAMILEEIVCGKDQMDDLVVKQEVQMAMPVLKAEDYVDLEGSRMDQKKGEGSKMGMKKNRKILMR